MDLGLGGAHRVRSTAQGAGPFECRGSVDLEMMSSLSPKMCGRISIRSGRNHVAVPCSNGKISSSRIRTPWSSCDCLRPQPSKLCHSKSTNSAGGDLRIIRRLRGVYSCLPDQEFGGTSQGRLEYHYFHHQFFRSPPLLGVHLPPQDLHPRQWRPPVRARLLCLCLAWWL